MEIRVEINAADVLGALCQVRPQSPHSADSEHGHKEVAGGALQRNTFYQPTATALSKYPVVHLLGLQNFQTT